MPATLTSDVCPGPALDADLGGGVDDGLAAVEGGGHRPGVGDVTPDRFGGHTQRPEDVRQSGRRAGQDADLGAPHGPGRRPCGTRRTPSPR